MPIPTRVEDPCWRLTITTLIYDQPGDVQPCASTVTEQRFQCPTVQAVMHAQQAYTATYGSRQFHPLSVYVELYEQYPLHGDPDEFYRTWVMGCPSVEHTVNPPATE